jgi:leucine-rich repeat protein SHOC2
MKKLSSLAIVFVSMMTTPCFATNTNSLQAAKENPLKIVDLSISYLHLESFKQTLPKLIKLRDLKINPDCKKPAKVAVPVEIGELKELRKLSIGAKFGVDGRQDCDLTLSRLPTTIGNLKHLEVASFDDAFFDSEPLPATFWGLTSLKRIRFTRLNPKTSTLKIPADVSNLVNLEELILDYARLQALPEEIGKLEKLKILSLMGNDLTRLPDSIGSLKTLSELNLCGNKLTDLPRSLNSLKNLKSITIGPNALSQPTQSQLQKDFGKVKLEFDEESCNPY